MNKLDLDGRVAVVTGGARGIGYAVAERMSASGATVALWDQDGTAAQNAAAALGASASGHVADVTRADSIRTALDATLARHGKVDILVNNAGITGGNAPLWDLPEAEWRRVIEVNLIGPYLVSAAVVPGMTAQGWGRVVNIASVAGKEGNPNASHYSASKAGLIGLTKSLGKELAGSGVLVNCVTPAVAKTELFQQMSESQISYMLSKIPMGRFIELDEIAAMVCWLASPDCSASTAGVFDITGGRATY